MTGPDAACRCDIAWKGGEAVGIVTWFWTYKSFRARRGLYLEDLFVRPPFAAGAWARRFWSIWRTRRARRMGFMEWQVLDWNAPAIAFYQSLGARPVPEWLNYRLEGEASGEAGVMSEIVLVVAIADNGVIGKDGAIPWRISDDMKRFKALTMGHTVVMGRKTWDSLPQKAAAGPRQCGGDAAEGLAGRRRGHASLAGAGDVGHVRHGDGDWRRGNLSSAPCRWRRRIELTEVHKDFDGDARFAFDRSGWHETAREDHVTPDGLRYSYVTLTRT